MSEPCPLCAGLRGTSRPMHPWWKVWECCCRLVEDGWQMMGPISARDATCIGSIFTQGLTISSKGSERFLLQSSSGLRNQWQKTRSQITHSAPINMLRALAYLKGLYFSHKLQRWNSLWCDILEGALGANSCYTWKWKSNTLDQEWLQCGAEISTSARLVQNALRPMSAVSNKSQSRLSVPKILREPINHGEKMIQTMRCWTWNRK